jgi:hypothetical protein
MILLRWRRRFVAAALAMAVVATSCTGGDGQAADQPPSNPSPVVIGPTAPPTDASERPKPVPFVPAGRVGDSQAYDDLITALEVDIPAELRSSVPWPDIRNADPAVAQLQIFDLWIWMNETHPDPRLVDLLAAPESPNRGDIVQGFADLLSSNQLAVRTGAPYRAFNQQAITFESAGLPLWLTRDVPDHAVVIYYSDESGPTEHRDRDTGAVLDTIPGIPTRNWVSIMVETDVGWLLWRDQVIDSSTTDLETPDRVPSTDAERIRPEL